MNGADSIVTVVIVTFNRRQLLERCLISIVKQTHKPYRVLVVDNASTDGSSDWLREWLPGNLPGGTLIGLNDNLGGAAGFSEGLRQAVEDGADWVWMMDDDADPEPNALENLVARELNPRNIYASTAISGSHLAWAAVPMDPLQPIIRSIEDMPHEMPARSAPFLGILVSSLVVSRIGLPDADLFIYGDDVEYCRRARADGSHIILISDSRINHPAAEHYSIQLFGRRIGTFRIAPWKRYYDVRNRILISKKYDGFKTYYSVLPGSFLRLLATLVHQEHRGLQLWAFVTGMLDGLLGKMGKRHLRWNIHN